MSGVCVFSGMYKWWNSCIIFKSLITNTKVFLHFSKKMNANGCLLRLDLFRDKCLFGLEEFIFFSQQICMCMAEEKIDLSTKIPISIAL